MSTLKSHEKIVFEKLFDRGGYVLNFNENAFAEFFREHNININTQKYYINGNSKMKRLRSFWELEPDIIVGNVLEALLKYAKASEDIDSNIEKKALVIIDRLLGKKQSNNSEKKLSEDDFLKEDFGYIEIDKLELDSQFQSLIGQRINEIQITLKHNAALACIFLCGSTLEGLLLDTATKYPQRFNTAVASPKNQNEKVKPFHEWTLDSLINVAHEIQMLSLDTKKYSHTLKDFRNYIHPREQAAHKFNPDMHTAKISWQVLQAAIADLSGKRKTNV